MPEQQDKARVVAWGAPFGSGVYFGRGWVFSPVATERASVALVRQSDHLTEVARLRAEGDRLAAALLAAARRVEQLKRPCGMEPDSPQAIRNSEYMAISLSARVALTAYEASKGEA